MRRTNNLLPLLTAGAALLVTPALAQPPAGDPLGPDVFRAIGRGDVRTLNALLDKGAKPDQANWLGYTPLLWASVLGNQAACDALLAHGASPKADSIYGGPLELAQMSGSPTLAAHLLSRGVAASQQRLDKITPLMLAAERGDVAAIDLWLGQKAAIDARDMAGASALDYAVRRGRIEAARRLLDAGATVGGALHEAAKNGHPALVTLLLDRGASATARDPQGDTPLLLAARYGDPESVRRLLAAGADPSARDRSGRTAAEWTRRRQAAVASLPRQARVAVGRSVPLIERTTRNFTKVSACGSCHHQGLGLMATGAAKRFGVAVDAALAREQRSVAMGDFQKALPQLQGVLPRPELHKMVPGVDMDEYAPVAGFLLGAMVEQKAPRTPVTDALASLLAGQQAPDGAWRFHLHREPVQSSHFMTTALAVRSLTAYLPANQAVDRAKRIARAKVWLAATPARTTEDRTWRLLGLRWAGASPTVLASASKALLVGQRADGGWAQLPTATEGAAYARSDAYATGQALWALAVGGGVSTESPAWKRGAAYLVRTQDDDGSWFVQKRAVPVNNYFDTGFPHGASQYVSYSATCWATMALSLTSERPTRQISRR